MKKTPAKFQKDSCKSIEELRTQGTYFKEGGGGCGGKQGYEEPRKTEYYDPHFSFRKGRAGRQMKIC